MRHFYISPLDERYRAPLLEKINNLTKPKGALGRLEEIALQVGMIQRSLTPELHKPYNIIFCADHGIVNEGISQSPKEVTWQVVYNILSGGAGVCYLSRQHGVETLLVDVGVDYEFGSIEGLIDRKIMYGTESYLEGYAMTESQFDRAIEVGVEMVERAQQEGANIVSFGEMGITNTAASALWMSILTGMDLRDCVGRGSGLDDAGLEHKCQILKRALEGYQGSSETIDYIRYFGGLEMVAALGGMLRAAELRMTILVDGFIMTACLLAARALYPLVEQYAIFGHQGDEAGHARLLNYLGAKPLLHLGMRLGEGSGAVCALPIVHSSVRMLSEMASFAGAGVTKYFDQDTDETHE